MFSFVRSDPANGWPATNVTELLTGAAMNAILHYPANLAAELHQLKVDVAAHCQEIVVEATAFKQTQTAWSAQEPDLARRMNALRQRLANLLA